MLRIRRIEEAIAEYYVEQEMRVPVHLSIGQEAIAVGVCQNLSHSDYIMSTHRGHAHYLAKDGDFKKMMAEIYGKSTGCCGGRGGSMHLVDLAVGMMGCTPVVGSTMPVAVGLAFGSQLKKQNNVTVLFFGEGSTEEGVFYEAVNFAALKKLPILFVCENNLYSVYSPLAVRQPSQRNLLKICEGLGITALQGNGNNIEEVFSLAQNSIKKIRDGNGPHLLELSTYRWREHCGPGYDNHIGYRTEAEFLAWKQKCPIEFYQKKLIQENILDAEKLASYEIEIKQEIEKAIRFAKESEFPKTESMSSFVFA